MVSIVSLATPN
jgi:Ca2+-binding EF-hand superfamily protein